MRSGTHQNFLFFLVFILDLAKESLVALAEAATSFLVMGREVGFGDSYDVCGGSAKDGEG